MREEEVLEETHMQLTLNLETLAMKNLTPRNRVHVQERHPQQERIQSCSIELAQLAWKEREQLIKEVLQRMELTPKNEVKATFYFEDETKVELPRYFRQRQSEWVTEISLKLRLTSLGLWVSKLKNKQTGCSLYDFPLHRVDRLQLTSIQPSCQEQMRLQQLWRRKHHHLWTHLTFEDLTTYLPNMEVLSVTNYFHQEDILYALGCFEWEEEFEIRAETPRLRIKARATWEADGYYRAWVLVYNTHRRRLKRYIWLNESEALLYQEERY